MEFTKHQRIELLAYYIYLAEGRTEGHALDHWREAEFQIETYKFGGKSAVPKKSTGH